MALVKCPDCGKMVSERASVCPECGCPAEFFVRDIAASDSDETAPKESSTPVKEEIEFDFSGYKIKYPANSSKYAGLYGDYVKLGLDAYNTLCEGCQGISADGIAKGLYDVAQKMIDDQLESIVKELYQKGVVLNIAQLKSKYSDLPLDFPYEITPFAEEYNNIMGIDQNFANERAAAYANRTRWTGGGFGIRGALKGAAKAQVLNVGSSIVSGIGNAVVRSIDDSNIERKKEQLASNKSIIESTCEYITICFGAIFNVYTNELDLLGELGEKINIDFETANTRYQAALKYENDSDRLFEAIVDCLSIYPSSRTFFDKVEMRLEATEGWEDFVSFWHLGFLYQSKDNALLKMDATYITDKGQLKLTKEMLMFIGNDPSKSKNIPIGRIKSVRFLKRCFQLELHGEFGYHTIETTDNELWVKTIENARQGIFEAVDVKTIQASADTKEELIEYIKANYTWNNKMQAIRYYMDHSNESLKTASDIVRNVLEGTEVPDLNTDYPGTEKLLEGYYAGQPIVAYYGDGKPEYSIITKNEVIILNTKKKQETRFDVFKISGLKSGPTGSNIVFRYPGSLLEKNVHMQGCAHDAIEKIKKIQNGQL